MERIRAESIVVRTRSVIVLTRLVDRDPGNGTLAPLSLLRPAPARRGPGADRGECGNRRPATS